MDLRTTGVYPYAQHKDTDIWCMAWAFDDEEPVIWVPGEHLPPRIIEHIQAGGELRAWNAQFERVIWNEIMRKRYFNIPVHISQWVCTAAEAAAMALPRSLDQAAIVLNIGQKKDKGGYELMMRMTRPRRTEDDGTPVWWDVDERKQRLFAYCIQDVRVERAIKPALRRLTPHEREVYLLDQRMNDKGVRIDRELIVAAQNIACEGTDRADAVIAELTGGQVAKVTSVAGLTQWVRAQGVETASVAKAAVRELLDGDLSPEVRRVLEVRAEAGRSSLAKLGSMLEVACTDDRARGLLMYHGASTGRWTGKLIQPQNFPKGEVADIESYIPAVLAGSYDSIDILAAPTVVVSSMLRSMLVADLGHDLIAADFSAIEARVLNWLAGQTDMIENFRAYDAGDKARDPYIINAMRLYNIPFAEVKKMPHRHTGKFQELGCGYGMGAKKAVTAAKAVYQLEITDKQAKEIVDNYRSTHKDVVDFWYATERACLTAIEQPGQAQTFGAGGLLKAVVAGAYLYLILPSGRPLCYAAPRVVDALTPWGAMKLTMEFSGMDSFTRQWGRLRAYGGLLVENIVQAVSRDLMADAMLRLDAAGYTPVLSVHDEVLSEVPMNFGSVAEFETLMSERPTWANNCPIAVEGWRGARYRK